MRLELRLTAPASQEINRPAAGDHPDEGGLPGDLWVK
jgi:hypothetical protein